MELYNEWEEKIENISTNNFNISVGELINRYSSDPKKLFINPAYQRHYRWSNQQKSNFIESLLLGYPIPPIFMYRDTNNGVWEVIDGLQRLATILEFVGVLEKDFPRKEKLVKLLSTSIFKSLENKTWNDFITSKLDFVLESQSLQVMVLDNKSGLTTKYEIFRRLNSSSTTLSAQEIRNATLFEIAPIIYENIEKQFLNLDFTFLSSLDKYERKDMELFLEFLLIKQFFLEMNSSHNTITLLLDNTNNFTDLLNEFSILLTSYELEEGAYEFIIFMQKYSKYSFKYTKEGKIQGAFINAYFEIFCSLYMIGKSKEISDIMIETILSKRYAEWQSERGVNNPSAINRLKLSLKYSMDISNEG